MINTFNQISISKLVSTGTASYTNTEKTKVQLISRNKYIDKNKKKKKIKNKKKKLKKKK
jgi:hypothetical protein